MGDVIRVTNGRQHPELSLRFSGANAAFLGTHPAPTTTTTPASMPAPQPTPVPSPPTTVAPGFVRIPGGTFMMGTASGGNNNERLVRQVTVSSFQMGIYPVTQREWLEIMGSNPSRFKGDNLPVESVSWFDAVNFCNRLSLREGLTPVYTISGSGNRRTVTWNRDANGYRLPTEAEWEYAARGGNGSPGNFIYSGSNNVDEVAWYRSNSGRRTHPAGIKAPNALGLYDMSGNVLEWVWDWFGSYSNMRLTDPVGPDSGSLRVIRGGSWGFNEHSLRSASRFSIRPGFRRNFIGFRLVLP
jgi:formylglycine-generating enzyme required for sulfatase activity